jgi:hypothetical protein
MEIFRVKTGRVVKDARQDDLDQFDVNWHSAANGIPANWMRHPRDPVQFFVSPPPLAGTTLRGQWAQTPTVKVASDRSHLRRLRAGHLRLHGLARRVARRRVRERAARGALLGGVQLEPRDLRQDQGDSGLRCRQPRHPAPARRHDAGQGRPPCPRRKSLSRPWLRQRATDGHLRQVHS